jgi:hypothetical protein
MATRILWPLPLLAVIVALGCGSTGTKDDMSDAGAGGAGTGGAGMGGAGLGSSGTGGISTSADAKALCAADADQQRKLCPDSASRETLIADCEADTSRFDTIGCGAAWLDYVACTSNATYSCEEGPTTCEAEQMGYFVCQSTFTNETGCTRIPGYDKKCSESKPYGFGCLGTLPASCESLEETPTGACCAAFPAK